MAKLLLPEKPKQVRINDSPPAAILVPVGTTQKHMTEVKSEDGSTIVTELPAEAVADLQAPKPQEKPAEAKPAEVTPPVEPKTEEPKAEPAKEPAAAPEGKKPGDPPKREPKASPFQTLLEKKHDAEQRAEAAEAKLKELSEQPKSAATTADIKAFAEKYGLEEAFAADLVSAIQAGMKPELPKEVQDLIAAQETQKQAQAEEAAFKVDYSRLEETLKDDVLKNPEVRERIQELAYSTEKAPDGEPYFKKPLYELYHKFVKPEFEPGKKTVEASRGGSRTGAEVMDFSEIHGDETKLAEFATKATSEQWGAYTKWRDGKQGDVPIIRQR